MKRKEAPAVASASKEVSKDRGDLRSAGRGVRDDGRATPEEADLVAVDVVGDPVTRYVAVVVAPRAAERVGVRGAVGVVVGPFPVVRVVDVDRGGRVGRGTGGSEREAVDTDRETGGREVVAPGTVLLGHQHARDERDL